MATDWQAVNLADVEKQIADPDFIHKSACGCLMPIHTFRIPGEYIEGRLRPCPNHDRSDRARAIHLYFPTKTEKEVGVAIRCSKMLWDAIANDKNPLWGKWIRITYKGSKKTTFGHAKKIYLVEYDKGVITEHFEPADVSGGKNKKPRAARRIRRPAGSGVTK